jgi:hypothetical protein
MADRSRALGLELADLDGPEEIPTTPEVVTTETAARRALDARMVLSSVIKATDAEDVTIARVDWIIDAQGNHLAVELNPHIPGSGTRADAVACAWLEVVGDFAGLTREAILDLIAANGSNTEELRQSLLAHSEFEQHSTPSIAIVHRDGDANVAELNACRRHFILRFRGRFRSAHRAARRRTGPRRAEAHGDIGVARSRTGVPSSS